MRIISRYVFREIVASALLGTLLATFVLFLQRVDKYFELLVRSSAKLETVGWLFALALPPVLPLTVPFGVLVGILIGLGRMSTDGEITAMRAAGVSSRAVIPPVLTFALLAMLVAGASSLWLTPRAIRQSIAILNKLEAEQLTADIQPRIFEEQFPNTILYVGDVKPGQLAVWKNVFLADLTPPEKRSIGLGEKADGPRITVAREAIAIPDVPHSRIQLSLREASTHEVDKDGVADDSSYRGEQILEAAPPAQVRARAFSEMNTGELKRYSRTGPDWVEARIELHQRMALPLACIMLALVGIPLGVSSRKGGKSAGYVTGLFLAFFCYHLSFITLIGLAKQHVIPVETAVYNFFELMGDIVRNHIAMSRVFLYLFFLIPKLIYDTLPVSVLVAVLVTFGVLTKHNEVTAFKACGVSLHRLAAPVLAVALFFSAGLFAFDHFYVPDANRKQDALRNEIKGRPVQTYLNPQRKWILGSKG